MPYSAADVRSRNFMLRMLLVAPPKAGKTTTAATTSPGPVFIFNTDGQGALDPVVQRGGEFVAEDIQDTTSAKKAMFYLKQNLSKFNTIIFDNISVFAGMVETEVRKTTRDDPRAVYPEYSRRLMEVFNDLLLIPKNIIVIGHVEAGESGVAGGFNHMLSVAGKPKTFIPAMMQDWVWLNVDIDVNTKKTRREFLLAPQGNWTKGVRSIKDTVKMEADITAFIALAQKESQPKTVIGQRQVQTTKTVVKQIQSK